MIPTSTASSVALYVLRQTVTHRAGQPDVSLARSSIPAGPKPAEETSFGINTMDVTTQKVRLMERLGEAFGIAMEDHADARSFGMAIREIVGKLKLSPEGRSHLARIEHEIGLDKLGITIDTVIGAMIDPMGNDAEELDAALKAKMGETPANEDEVAALERLALMGLDAAGLYGV